MLRTVGRGIRRINAHRIRDQKNPDGSRFKPRQKTAKKSQRYEMVYRNRSGEVSTRTVTGVIYKRKGRFDGYDSKTNKIRSFRKEGILKMISVVRSPPRPKGSKEKGRMFRRIRHQRFLKVQNVRSREVDIGFRAKVARIAAIHNYGKVYDRKGNRMPVRELLGIDKDTEKQVWQGIEKWLGVGL